MAISLKRRRLQTGVNLVARAFGRDRFQSSILDARVRIFSIDDGETVPSIFRSINFAVGYVMEAISDNPESPDFRKLKSAKSLLDQRVKDGCVFRHADAVTLDNALEIAARVWPTIPAVKANRIVNEMSGMAA